MKGEKMNSFEIAQEKTLKFGRILSLPEIEDETGLADNHAVELRNKLIEANPELPAFDKKAHIIDFDLESGNNPKIKMRKCLGNNSEGDPCGKMFKSYSVGNRICPDCKASVNFGGRYYD